MMIAYRRSVLDSGLQLISSRFRFSSLILFFCILPVARAQDRSPAPDPIAAGVLAAARKQVALNVRYQQTADALKYPGGDVAAEIGVCTDMIIRSFRAVGLDLQKSLHEDRVAHPDAYPTEIWEYKRADASIDHRRCQNLVVWFKRFAKSLPVAIDAETLRKDWKGGDVVFFVKKGADHPWHVAIVSDRLAGDGIPLVIDLFPPGAAESRRIDQFGPIHSHFRVIQIPSATSAAPVSTARNAAQNQ